MEPGNGMMKELCESENEDIMNNMRTLPVPGEFYRHFKNRIYQIVAIANHSETNEPMVVYQALYGDFKIWVRPLPMFMEEVDRVKYPDVEQKYRFEKIEIAGAEAVTGTTCAGGNSDAEKGADGKDRSMGRSPESDGEPRPMSPHLLAFFDAMDEKQYDYMLEALAKLAGHATQKEIDDICLVMDMQTVGVSVEEQIAEIRRHIHMLKKFDGVRLR